MMTVEVNQNAEAIKHDISITILSLVGLLLIWYPTIYVIFDRIINDGLTFLFLNIYYILVASLVIPVSIILLIRRNCLMYQKAIICVNFISIAYFLYSNW